MYLFLNILFGIIFLVIGSYYWLNPPPYNHFWGYRTRRAKRNEDTWEEANRYASDMMIYAGIAASSIGIFFYLFEPNPMGLLASMALSFVSAILFISLTELHLRTTFDENGQRKFRP